MCLLGERVRYDGGHKRHRYVTEVLARYFHLVPICPEVELGMGIPRETLRLVRDGDEIRMLAGGVVSSSALRCSMAGRAIVSSDAGGLPELIRHGEPGLVARSNDAASFVERIGELLEDPALRAELGQAARASVERSFNHIEIGRQSVAVYESVLAREAVAS